MQPDMFEEVACCFAAQYYKSLADDPTLLAPLYGENATAAFHSPNEKNLTAAGKELIAAHLVALGQFFGPRKVEIKSVEHTKGWHDLILVCCTGNVFTETHDRSFSQTFVIVPGGGPNNYFIAIDVMNITSVYEHPVRKPTPTPEPTPEPEAIETMQPFIEMDESTEAQPAEAAVVPQSSTQPEAQQPSREHHRGGGEGGTAGSANTTTRPSRRRPATQVRQSRPPTYTVLLRDVPQRARLLDVEASVGEYGRLCEVKWYGRRDALVTFSRLRDAQDLVSDQYFSINGRYVTAEWYS